MLWESACSLNFMANPILNEKSFSTAAGKGAEEAGWAAPSRGAGTTWNPPINDGPSSPWQTSTDRMTASGAASATMVLLALLLGGATFGWLAVPQAAADGTVKFPGIAAVGIIVGLIAAFTTAFKPHLARITAPIYAIAEGIALGAISKMFEIAYDGIVIQAVGATLGVFAAMLFMYRTGVIRVNDKYRRIVFGAMIGLMVFYGISFLINIFGGNVSFFHSSSGFSILFSIFVAGLAAANLALDFDFIERGEKAGYPKQMEWFAAFGVLVTLVWLYLEILNLLAKLRDN